MGLNMTIRKLIYISVTCLALFIVATIVVPAVFKLRISTGPHDGCRTMVNMIDKAISMYHAEHGKYPGKDLFKDLTGSGDDDGQPGYGYRLRPSSPLKNFHLLL
jgi:hypothetical protein